MGKKISELQQATLSEVKEKGFIPVANDGVTNKLLLSEVADLKKVEHDATLEGEGTSENPLSAIKYVVRIDLNSETMIADVMTAIENDKMPILFSVVENQFYYLSKIDDLGYGRRFPIFVSRITSGESAGRIDVITIDNVSETYTKNTYNYFDYVRHDDSLEGDGTGASPLGYIVKGGEGVGRSVPNGGEVFNSYYNPLAPEIENVASGDYSHAEGNTTKATGFCCHAEGVRTQATTNCAHAEGSECIASGSQSHAEGAWNVASGLAAHAEGYETKAEAIFSHAEGYGTQSFAEDEDAGIDGFCSHVEGYCSKTKGFFTHAEGSQCEAIGQSSHAEGFQCEAIGQSSHAEGSQCEAIGQSSHAEGSGSVANGYFQHVSGKYNVPDTTSAEIIGNGTDNENRSNARTLDWYGNETLAGDVIVKGNRNLRTELENESAQRMSADTALQNAIDTKEPAFSLLPISKGGTNASNANDARNNLDVYSKAEVDSLSNGKVKIVASLPSSGENGVIYFVGPIGSGADKYKEYIWNSDGNSFIQVGDISIDLSGYLNSVATSGNGNAVTGFTKSGNSLTLTKGATFATSSELTAERTARESAISAEATARSNADTALQTSIDAKQDELTAISNDEIDALFA